MAKEDDKRKKFWEDDEEDQDLKPKAGKTSSIGNQSGDSAQVDQKLHEAKVLMDQTHQLYLQFFGGIEKRTPIEKVKQLEGKINELQRLGTNITTSKFKISQFLAQYSTMKELWERKLRERERK